MAKTLGQVLAGRLRKQGVGWLATIDDAEDHGVCAVKLGVPDAVLSLLAHIDDAELTNELWGVNAGLLGGESLVETGAALAFLERRETDDVDTVTAYVGEFQDKLADAIEELTVEELMNREVTLAFKDGPMTLLEAVLEMLEHGAFHWGKAVAIGNACGMD